MPKHSIISEKRKMWKGTSASSRINKRKYSDDESSGSTHSCMKPNGKNQVISARSTTNFNSDCDDEAITLDDPNPDFEKLIQSFHSKMSKIVKAKAKKVDNFTSGKLLKNIKVITDSFSSAQVKTQNCCSFFDAQYLEITKKMEKEQEQLNAQIENVAAILEQIQKSQTEFKVSQQNYLRDLNEIRNSFVKNMAGHIKTLEEECDEPLCNIKKEVQYIQKNILKKAEENEMLNVRKSLSSMLW